MQHHTFDPDYYASESPLEITQQEFPTRNPLLSYSYLYIETAGVSERDLSSLVTLAEIAFVKQKDYRVKKHWFLAKCDKLKLDHLTHGHIEIDVRRDNLLHDSVGAVLSIPQKDLPLLWNVGFCTELVHGHDGFAKEWFVLVTKRLFDPLIGLWQDSKNDRNGRLPINPWSGIVFDGNDDDYFRFAGRMVGKAIFDGRVIPFRAPLYLFKVLTGHPVALSDLKQVDEELYRSIERLDDEVHLESIGLNFTLREHMPFEEGMQSIELVPFGAFIQVTHENLNEYKISIAKYVLFDRVRRQLHQLVRGIYEVVPKALLSVFEPTELEVLLCGCSRNSYDVELEQTWRIV